MAAFTSEDIRLIIIIVSYILKLKQFLFSFAFKFTSILRPNNLQIPSSNPKLSSGLITGGRVESLNPFPRMGSPMISSENFLLCIAELASGPKTNKYTFYYFKCFK